MCRSYQTKEDVFITQNSAGAGNNANFQKVEEHMSKQNIISIVGLSLIALILDTSGTRVTEDVLQGGCNRR